MAGDQQIEWQQKTVYDILSDAVLLGPRLLLSRLALRAYITTALLLVAAVTSAATAVVVYLFFYNLYIPHPGFVKPIHLQFEQNQHTWATVSLESSAGPTLASFVKYDVDVSFHLPRSPVNVAAGNFMLELRVNELPEPGPNGFTNLTTSVSSPSYDSMRTLAVSRRPAVLKYRSRLVENAKKACVIALYVIGWKEEAETLTLNMMEGVEFGRWRVPKSMRLEVQSAERMQIYWMQVEFRAKLGVYGLPHVQLPHHFFFDLHDHLLEHLNGFRNISLVPSVLLLQRKPQENTDLILSSKRIKEEPQDNEDDEPDLSDTSRTFPTSSRQPLLRYSGSFMSRIKKEEEDDRNPDLDTDDVAAPPLPPRHSEPSPAADGDVEDEEDDFIVEGEIDSGRTGSRSDSGLGTSMESSAATTTSIRRRGSKQSR